MLAGSGAACANSIVNIELTSCLVTDGSVGSSLSLVLVAIFSATSCAGETPAEDQAQRHIQSTCALSVPAWLPHSAQEAAIEGAQEIQHILEQPRASEGLRDSSAEAKEDG